jgi:hypothetical protein
VGRSRILSLAGIAVACMAAPLAGAAGEPGGARSREVACAPLFDASTRFKPNETVMLRFRLEDKASRAPIPLKAISVSLLHPPREPEVRLSPRKVRQGVFEVPFTPRGPGRYTLLVAVRGAPERAIPPLHLGVVGVADGLKEQPPSADPDAKQRARALGRSTR